MLLALLLACAPPQEAARATLRRREVLLAHTNDLHAHFRPVPAPWLEGSPRIGGFEAIDAHLRSLRAAVGDVVYLDGGDLMTGTPLMELAEDGVAGGAMLRFLEAAGCDAWVVGNHELDRGIEHARQLVASSGVPVLTANLMDRSGQPLLPGSLPHHIVEHNNLKIGVFGLTTDAMASLTARETAAQLQVRSLAAVAREQVAVLEPQVDLVVALTHSGLDGDMALAEAVDGIDLIVGGHTHSSVEPPILVDGTWIVQAGSYGRQLGLVRLTVDDGEVGAFSGALVDLRLESLPGDASPAVRALSRRMASAVDAAYGQQLGVLPAPLERGGSGESPMGRWGAEAVRRAAGADVGAACARISRQARSQRAPCTRCSRSRTRSRRSASAERRWWASCSGARLGSWRSVFRCR